MYSFSLGCVSRCMAHILAVVVEQATCTIRRKRRVGSRCFIRLRELVEAGFVGLESGWLTAEFLG